MDSITSCQNINHSISSGASEDPDRLRGSAPSQNWDLHHLVSFIKSHYLPSPFELWFYSQLLQALAWASLCWREELYLEMQRCAFDMRAELEDATAEMFWVCSKFQWEVWKCSSSDRAELKQAPETSVWVFRVLAVWKKELDWTCYLGFQVLRQKRACKMCFFILLLHFLIRNLDVSLMTSSTLHVSNNLIKQQFRSLKMT